MRGSNTPSRDMQPSLEVNPSNTRPTAGARRAVTYTKNKVPLAQSESVLLTVNSEY